MAVSNKPEDVLGEVLARVNPGKAEVITIYYGADTTPADTEQVVASIREKYPKLQIEVIKGGQPHYNYMVSVE